MRLSEPQREKLRNLTEHLIVDIRDQALRAKWNPLDLWDQISNRAFGATRTSQNPAEWATNVLRHLRLLTPSKFSSTSLVELSALVYEMGCAPAWLDLVEREHALIIAHARKLVEERQAAALAAKTPADTTETDHV